MSSNTQVIKTTKSKLPPSIAKNDKLMENKYLIKNCTLIPTEGSSLSEEFEISGGNPTIVYYESLKSPSISLSIQFIDVDQLISREGITGGEYLDLIIKHLIMMIL